jgi:hypothetical protein
MGSYKYANFNRMVCGDGTTVFWTVNIFNAGTIAMAMVTTALSTMNFEYTNAPPTSSQKLWAFGGTLKAVARTISRATTIRTVATSGRIWMAQ